MGKVRKIVDTPPLYSQPDKWVERVYGVGTPFIERKPAPKTIMFFTRGADLKRGYGGAVPTVIIGPGQPEMAHQTDEWCSMNRIDQSVEIFEQIMREWNGI